MRDRDGDPDTLQGLMPSELGDAGGGGGGGGSGTGFTETGLEDLGTIPDGGQASVSINFTETYTLVPLIFVTPGTTAGGARDISYFITDVSNTGFDVTVFNNDFDQAEVDHLSWWTVSRD